MKLILLLLFVLCYSLFCWNVSLQKTIHWGYENQNHCTFLRVETGNRHPGIQFILFGDTFTRRHLSHLTLLDYEERIYIRNIRCPQEKNFGFCYRPILKVWLHDLVTRMVKKGHRGESLLESPWLHPEWSTTTHASKRRIRKKRFRKNRVNRAERRYISTGLSRVFSERTLAVSKQLQVPLTFFSYVIAQIGTAKVKKGWKYSYEEIHIMKQIHPGAVILLHAIKRTMQTLERVITMTYIYEKPETRLRKPMRDERKKIKRIKYVCHPQESSCGFWFYL